MSKRELLRLVLIALVPLLFLCACGESRHDDWTVPVNATGSWSNTTTVFRKVDELGNLVYWTSRGGVFVVPKGVK